eukprot:gb/GFBE01023048.1/.p1 GENE.gb/GFBE01023048.1/~~gb/GFBE01023048.1/.p1  ORF type:complete len:218 (+),score=45.03 gb/GFBE01023048.1/:1-654(+)
MGLLQPAAPVIGPLSLPAIVGILLLVHFAICTLVLANVRSDKNLEMGDAEVSSTFMCLHGAFCLLGIPVIIHAGIGTLYRVPSHLSAYITYQFATMAVLAFDFWGIASSARSCVTQAARDPGELATLVCGLPGIGTFFTMTLVLLCISVAIYLVWSLNENIKQRNETDLFRYQEPLQLQAQMAAEATAQAAKEAQAAAAAAHRMAVPGALWSPAAVQ